MTEGTTERPDGKNGNFNTQALLVDPSGRAV